MDVDGLMLPSLVLAEAYVLVSWWKAVLLALPVVGWGWYISTVLDKHAARFMLPRKSWNAVHLGVGAIAVLGGFVGPALLPVQGIGAFFAAFFIIAVPLAIEAAVFTSLHNKDDRVGEDNKVKLDFSEWTEKREQAKADKLQGTVTMTFVRPDKMKLEAPDKESPEYEVRIKAESLYADAMGARASKIDIEPIGGSGENTTFGVLVEVDGVRSAIEQLNVPAAVKIIDFWKNAAMLDVSDRRKKQVGKVSVGAGDQARPVRVTTRGGRSGPTLSLLIEPEQAVRREFDQMGLTDAQEELVRGWSLEQGGIVLLAAPAGNGLTTLMYSTLRLHDAYTSVVQTIELDVQDAVEGVRQSAWDPTAEGPSHAHTVRSTLRRDPDVVGVTEMVTPETAAEIVDADIERSRVYVGLRADNALLAIRQFCKLTGDPAKVAKGLKGVVAGKLARKLCENCRVAYQPAPELLKKLGLPADRVRQLFKKSGQVIPPNKQQPETCPVCRGTGYLGRVGIWETYPITPEAKKAIEQENWDAVRAELRKHKEYSPFQAGALRLAVQGVTSVEELARVTAPPAKPGAKPAPKKASPAGA